VFYSVKLVSIALLLVVGLGHTHTTPRRQTPSPEGNATYKDFTKLDEWRFLFARINRANSHWSLSLFFRQRRQREHEEEADKESTKKKETRKARGRRHREDEEER
jgi:hypothetical protein